MLNVLCRQSLALAIGAMLSQPALALDYTWLGGTGNWITGAMWDQGGFPDSSTANVFIDGGKTSINSVVTLTGDRSVANIAVDAGDNLRIASGGLLNLYANLTNNGQVELTGGTAVLRVADNTTFAGNGRVVLGGDGNNYIQGIFGSSGNRLINGPGHTIEGAGNIGGIGMKLTNQGLILANSVNPLVIDPNDGPDGVINTGTFRAQDGARLILHHGTFTNTGAVIEALDASFVDFADSATVIGGTLSTAGSGLIRSFAATRNALTDVTLAGKIQVQNGSILTLTNTFTNNGQVELTGGTAVLRVADNTTFAGNGRVVLGGDGNNYIQGIFGSSGNRLINGPGHTIEGAGNIGGIGMKLTNQGLILANSVNPLVIDPNDDPDGVINTGTFRAQDGARLILHHGTFTNTGAVIEALDASFVDFADSATVIGGTLSTAGSGLIRSFAATQNALTDVTLAGKLQVQNGSILTLTNTFTNNGQVELTGGTAVLRVADNTTFAGNGRVVLGGDGNNYIQGIFGSSGNRLINGPGHTIEGAGNIGGIGMKLTNEGLIHANSANALVIDTIDTADGFFNRGTVRVDPTRTMIFTAGSGISMIQDGASARVEINGTLNVTHLDLQAGVLTGTGVVVGPVQNTGGIVAPGSSLGTLAVGNFTQGVLGTLAIELENLGSHDLLLVNGTASLDGTLALSCFAACSYAVGDEFVILDSTGNLTGTFGTGVTLSGFATGAFDVVYDTTLDEVRLRVTEEVTAVPEPESWTMLLAGLGFVSYAARRRRMK